MDNLIEYLYNSKDTLFKSSLKVGKIIKNNNIAFEFKGYSDFVDNLLDCDDSSEEEVFMACKSLSDWLYFFGELDNAINLIIEDTKVNLDADKNIAYDNTKLKLILKYKRTIKTQIKIMNTILSNFMKKYGSEQFFEVY